MGREKIVGVSTHSIEEAVSAETEGADYIGFGPVFPTITKDAGRPKGIGELKKINSSVKIPVVAIGGISPENCPSIFECGASAVAAASSVLSGDIRHNVAYFTDIVGRYAGSV
jgi:thiamine-phosphate diphosphorylase